MEEPSEPHHFVRDYRALTKKLIVEKPVAEAMALAVGGGDYEATGAAELDLLVEYGLRPSHSVIDIGCGSGRLSTALSKKYGAAITYLGTDVVPELLDYARTHAAANYRFELTDGLTIPAPNGCADFVIAVSVFTHLRGHETEQYFAEITRVLRPGARLIFSFFELPFHARALAASLRNKLLGKRDPEVHFISRATINRHAGEYGFRLQTFLPEKRGGFSWQKYPNHSIAVMQKL
jgi:SAM-dependent methyltransferase